MMSSASSRQRRPERLAPGINIVCSAVSTEEYHFGGAHMPLSECVLDGDCKAEWFLVLIKRG